MKTECTLLLASFLLAASAPASPYKHGYDLLDVNWGVAFNESDRTIAGDVTNTIRVTDANLSQIVLNEGKLNIKAVTVNEKSAAFAPGDHEQLVITLHEAVKRDDVLRVRVLYTGKPEAGVYFVTPDRTARPVTTNIVYTQGEAEDNRYWLPTYDEPDDKATSEGHISVPKGYFALSNGSLEEVVHEKNRDVFHWKMSQPHSTYLISFVAGKYFEGREKWDQLPVNYYVPQGLESWGPSTFGGTADMVQFYSNLTGLKYPYVKFAQSAVGDFPFGGMENITAVTQSITAVHPAKEFPFVDSRSLVLHELAHQWFGDLITCADWPHNWLNEGFATFLPHFYFRAKDGEDEFQIQKLGDIQGGLGSMNYKPRPMVATAYGVPMDIFDGHAYAGGSARLFTLMNLLGEKTFWTGVNAYLNEMKFKAATTDDFFRIMSRSTGQDLTQFENQWFKTAAVPNIKINREGGKITLTQAEPLFSLDVDVWALHEGHWNQQKVVLHDKQASLILDNATDPVVVDPLVKWMANISYAQTPSAEDLLAMYNHMPNAATKLRLLDIAAGQGYQTLMSSLMQQETSKILREEIATRLSSEDTPLLLKLSSDEDPKIRQAAVGHLQNGKGTDEVKARLTVMAGQEPSDAMKLAAIHALVTLTHDQALVDNAWKTDSYADMMRTFAIGWYGDNRPDLARALALKALSDGHSESVRLGAIAVLGQVKDKPGEKTVLNTLIALLSDHGHNTKLRAIGALRSYGDPAAVPELEKLSDFSMYQVRNSATQAARALKGK